MTDNNSAVEKRTVEELNFGSKTAKRVGWEAWEFSVEAPHLIRVTNASYGFEKDDHSYLVGVEDRDGVIVPAECECPADEYNEDYDCKHKVALTSVGGPIVLQAAVDCPTPGVDAGKTTTQTLEDKLRADGGVVSQRGDDDSRPLNAENHDRCKNSIYYCEGTDGDSLPCFDCFELEEGQ